MSNVIGESRESNLLRTIYVLCAVPLSHVKLLVLAYHRRSWVSSEIHRPDLEHRTGPLAGMSRQKIGDNSPRPGLLRAPYASGRGRYRRVQLSGLRRVKATIESTIVGEIRAKSAVLQRIFYLSI